MPARPLTRPTGQAFAALLRLLILALLLQGLAVAVSQVLGRAHVHRPAAAPAAAAAGWMAGLMSWRAGKVAELQARGVFRHAEPRDTEPQAAHTHEGLARHHHSPGDASVQPLDAAPDADAAAAGAAGAASLSSLPWDAAAGFKLPARLEPQGPWPLAPAEPWADAWVLGLDRPPQR